MATYLPVSRSAVRVRPAPEAAACDVGCPSRITLWSSARRRRRPPRAARASRALGSDCLVGAGHMPTARADSVEELEGARVLAAGRIAPCHGAGPSTEEHASPVQGQTHDSPARSRRPGIGLRRRSKRLDPVPPAARNAPREGRNARRSLTQTRRGCSPSPAVEAGAVPWSRFGGRARGSPRARDRFGPASAALRPEFRTEPR